MTAKNCHIKMIGPRHCGGRRSLRHAEAANSLFSASTRLQHRGRKSADVSATATNSRPPRHGRSRSDCTPAEVLNKPGTASIGQRGAIPRRRLKLFSRTAIMIDCNKGRSRSAKTAIHQRRRMEPPPEHRGRFFRRTETPKSSSRRVAKSSGRRNLPEQLGDELQSRRRRLLASSAHARELTPCAIRAASVR